MNNKHKVKICSVHVQFKQTICKKLREKRLTTYSFSFIAMVFVKSAKLK